MLALGICFLQTFSSAGRRIAACALLPTNRFVSITTNSMKYLVSWTPLRICVRSRNTRPHVNEWIRMDRSWKRVTRGSSGLKHLRLSGAQKFHTKVISHTSEHGCMGGGKARSKRHISSAMAALLMIWKSESQRWLSEVTHMDDWCTSYKCTKICRSIFKTCRSILRFLDLFWARIEIYEEHADANGDDVC